MLKIMVIYNIKEMVFFNSFLIKEKIRSSLKGPIENLNTPILQKLPGKPKNFFRIKLKK